MTDATLVRPATAINVGDVFTKARIMFMKRWTPWASWLIRSSFEPKPYFL